MKQFFRFPRGELSGKYIKSLLSAPNYVMTDMLNELMYHNLIQFKLLYELEDTLEINIRETDLIGIMKTAGLFQFYISTLTNLGSIMLAASHIVDGEERSERGLYDMYAMIFDYIRTHQDDYPTDIVTQATNVLRSTLVPRGTEIVGYLPYGTTLFNPDNGDIYFNNLLPDPPTDGTPYDIYYGDRFLVFEYLTRNASALPIEVLKLLFECLQRIRYNGPSIHEFMCVTKILGDGRVYDINIVPQGAWLNIEYQTRVINSPVETNCRIAAWKYICQQKFKLFNLIEP